MTDVPGLEPAPAPESKFKKVVAKGRVYLQGLLGLISKYPGTALLAAVMSHALRWVF